MITAEALFQHLAEGFPVGLRFHSAVVRLADAKPVHLGHVARADGAWRVYIFADRNDPTGENSHFRQLCEFLESDGSPIKRFTPAGADPDSVIDVRAIFQQGHRELAIDTMPSVLLPRKGKFGLIDYEKMFCPDPKSRRHLRPARRDPRDRMHGRRPPGPVRRARAATARLRRPGRLLRRDPDRLGGVGGLLLGGFLIGAGLARNNLLRAGRAGLLGAVLTLLVPFARVR